MVVSKVLEVVARDVLYGGKRIVPKVDGGGGVVVGEAGEMRDDEHGRDKAPST